MSRAGSHHLAHGQLRAIQRSPKPQTLLVAVPGVGTDIPDDWTDENGNPWLKSIPPLASQGLTIYCYVHGVSRSNGFSWHILLRHGERFLATLLQLIKDEKLEHCPVFFIGHSLGGLIVKEALRLAYEPRERYFRQIVQAFGGVVFLSVPHSASENEEIWRNAAYILQSDTLLSKRRTINDEDIKRLAASSMLFEQAAIPLPIMSIYETKETKVKLGKLSSKKLVLVGKDFVNTGSPNEDTVGVDSDHKSVCFINTRSPAYQAVCETVEIGLEDARLRLARDSPIYEAPSALDEWSQMDPHETVLHGGYQAKAESSYNPTTQSDPNTMHATVGSSDLGFEVIPAVTQIAREPPSPRLPCYMIPFARNRDFFGRAETFKELDTCFFPEANSTHEQADIRTFAICGPGGMGKTQVATEYAHRCKEIGKFDAIFWISADEPSKVADGLTRITLALGLAAEDSADARDQVITTNLAKGWLSNPVKNADPSDEEVDKQASWLIIFDNLDDANVLDAFWPLEGPGCVLFTTRDPLAKNSSFLAMTGTDLKPFSTKDSSAFIARLTKKTGDSKGVSERLGGLPLAITQMASVIIRRDLSFSEFNEGWDEKEMHQELLQLDVRRPKQGQYEKTLFTVWALDSLKHGGGLLDVVSFLDPDGIQEHMLDSTVPQPLTSFPRTRAAYQRARTELIQSSLVSKDSKAQKLVVHRLVQDVARAQMDDPRQRKAFSTAVMLVSSSWPYEDFGWRHGVARWRVCEDLFSHVLRLKHFSTDIPRCQESFNADLEYCRLLTDAGWYYHETGHSIESTPFFEEVQSIAEELKLLVPTITDDESSERSASKIKLDQMIAETHHNLGCIGTETNKPEFTLKHFKIFNKMMMAETERGAKKDKRVSVSWNELGNAYMMNKMWAPGEECFKESMRTARLMDDFEPTDLSFPYVNLGLAYWLTRRLDEAEQTLLEGLRIREAAYGVDDTQSFITGRFLYALGNVKTSQGMMDDSYIYHTRALRQFISTIGKNHHRTGDVHVRIAEHLSRRGNKKEAEMHLNEALRIFGDRTIYKPEKARALFKMSLLYKENRQPAEAKATYKDCIDCYIDIVGFDGLSTKPLTADTVDELVVFWSR